MTTVRDYDLSEVSKLLFPDYIGITMITFLHGYMTFTQPFLIQPLMGLKKLVRRVKPVMVHVFGQKAEGGLKGPWKTVSGMFVAHSTLPTA
ncbi:hypothetical protein K435DRAFT_775974 [Dendrothele bispora CBS 962.96]|uniref:Uncharacterized protein n=1 Tax=Dendrothele bispora (strain CBS 962.96) TaxID=1314807 RepID=A0A4S8MG03_DENBC|nr:hypothetical protein K435DRAFT_775974 [Dendrothele bispora CBS 962.96]